MDLGIVGLPNVGKSTLFNALTAAGALAANYPFATIEPNVGVVKVPDDRLGRIAKHIETKQIIPAAMRVVDIAGLVRGASQGEGLGNKFLSHIREVDAVAHVVRCFESPVGKDVTHVEGSVDPIRDIETIDTELILADLETVESGIPKAERAAKSREPEAVARLEVLKKLKPALEAGKPARSVSIEKPEEKKALRHIGLLTSKRVLYLANVDEDDVRGEGEHAMRVREHAEKEGMQAVPVCAAIESELSELDDADRAEMLESLGLDEPALHSVGRAGYELLELQSFFTAGPKEIKAWTIKRGSTAPEAAGTIHTDFERGFIRAEIYSVEDLEKYGSEKAIREAGRLRSEGKSYVMREGDVVNFLFNV